MDHLDYILSEKKREIEMKTKYYQQKHFKKHVKKNNWLNLSIKPKETQNCCIN